MQDLQSRKVNAEGGTEAQREKVTEVTWICAPFVSSAQRSRVMSKCCFLPLPYTFKDLSTGIWKYCQFAFSKNKDVKQTGKALDPFVPLLQKTSVCSVFIVQTLEKAISGWWKSLSTLELVRMQQRMFTITDFIPRDLETLEKKHTSIQTLTAITAPTSNWGQWPPQAIQLQWAFWGGSKLHWKC